MAGFSRAGGFFGSGGAGAASAGSIFTAMGEPTGFVNQVDSTLAFVNGTRTFTIAPAVTSFTYYVAGALRIKSASENIVIANTEGLHFIYYDDETLSETTTFTIDLLTTYVLVAIIYWDATNSQQIYFGDERHSITMDGMTHYNMHITKGAAYVSGLALGNFTADASGANDAHAQFSVANGVILDEDIFTTITDGSPQDISAILNAPVYYKDGASGVWRRQASSAFPVINFAAGSNLLAWNQNNGGTWQQTEVLNNQFVLAHIYAINDINTPIIAVQGQATYGNVPAAREGAENEITTLATSGLPFAEAVAIGSVIYQTSTGYANTPQARVRTTDAGDNYVDFRRSQGISAGNPFGLPEVSELEIVSVRFAGAKGDGVTDDYTAINNAIAAIGTDEQTLYFSAGNYYIGTSISIPANVNVIMDRGAVIQDNGDAGVNVTISGNLLPAPGETHFNLTGGGSTSITNTYRRVRVQESIPASVSTSGTGEDNLMTFTLPQNAHLYHNTVRITAAGTKTNLNGNKTLKFYCGTDSVTFHPAANNAIDWGFTMEMTLTGASERRAFWRGFHATSTQGYDAFTTDDLSAGSITLKVTGECSNAADTITQTMFIVELV